MVIKNDCSIKFSLAQIGLACYYQKGKAGGFDIVGLEILGRAWVNRSKGIKIVFRVDFSQKRAAGI